MLSRAEKRADVRHQVCGRMNQAVLTLSPGLCSMARYVWVRGVGRGGAGPKTVVPQGTEEPRSS